MAIKGYWRLNGNSNDASGNGNNGTDTSVTYKAGGAYFTGKPSKIKINDSTSLEFGQNGDDLPFSVSSVINRTASNTSDVIIGKGDNALPGYINWYISVISSNVCEFYLYGSNTSCNCWMNGHTSIPSSKYNHIFATYDGLHSYEGMKLYVNSIPQTITNAGVANYDGLRNTSTSNYIGAIIPDDTNYAGWSNSLISNVIIYNTEINYATVKNEYARIKGFF